MQVVIALERAGIAACDQRGEQWYGSRELFETATRGADLLDEAVEEAELVKKESESL